MTPFTMWDFRKQRLTAKNGSDRHKLFETPTLNAYIWYKISKTGFKIFLAEILRKLQIRHHL